MTATDGTGLKQASGSELLSLYTHQHNMADSNLAVERDITVKNFMAFGTVLLLQTGFFATHLKPHVIIAVCGLVIMSIALAARAMIIFYGKYSSRLFALASIYRKAYLRGRDGLYIIDRVDRLQDSGRLPDAEHLSLKEYFTHWGALATINTIPAIIGAILTIVGAAIWHTDVNPWDLMVAR
ncbi:hypothetical protein [Rhizobium sp. S163]|uniref:hypothetical protein n=1 Tax=Rhizobium sp. S163 TaxID=3055039 RepID=UPI0025AA0DDA|nr:hypothetical protein [Rhizobium sp. S163]MDM9645402.1 hypothetical protein [Rhizobium sp. S163]